MSIVPKLKNLLRHQAYVLSLNHVWKLWNLFLLSSHFGLIDETANLCAASCPRGSIVQDL